MKLCGKITSSPQFFPMAQNLTKSFTVKNQITNCSDQILITDMIIDDGYILINLYNASNEQCQSIQWQIFSA